MCPQLGITAQEHPRFRRLHSNFGLITCFTLSICSAAYMYKMLDEIISDFDAEVDDLAENTDEKRSRLNSSELKAVLDQRGVLYSSLLERRDVEFAVNSTGLITSSELKTAEAKQLELVNMNFSNSPDAFLYRKLINPVHQSLNSNRLSSSFTPISIIFDSESEFIEHVEDKKDSVWLLAVASPRSVENGDRIPSKIKPTSVVSEEVWAVLNHRYQSFGFKMGLLNCKKLHSLCIDRGFINPDLILALPKGGERMKDMVQFRPLPKEPKSKINADKKSSKYILDGIHSWIVSVLAERVKVLKDVRSIYPVSSVDQTMKNHYLKHLWSSWLSKRPQPIHVLWFPELSSKSKLAHPYQPPLVLSALSVTYTGRVRFWSVPNDLINQEYRTFTANADNWPVTTSYITTVHNLLTSLNCPNKCHFLILTPEGRCYPFGLNKKEFLSYENLEILLRSLYPSADDFLLMLLFITSLLVFINGAIEAGRISFILTHSFSENNRNNNLPERNYSNNRPSVTRRSALARTVIRLARQGWTSHVPSFIIDHHSMYNRSNDNSYRSTNHNHWNPGDQLNISPSQQPINMKLLILSHILEWIKIFLLDLVSACILLLLAILPIINILSLSYSMPIVNLGLSFLRSFALSAPIVKLRLSILSGHLNWSNLFSFILTFWFFLVVSSNSIYCLMLKYKKTNSNNNMPRSSYSRRLNRLDPVLVRERLNQISPDQLWNELSRLIIQSDIELKSGSADSTTSSTLESDHHHRHYDLQMCNDETKSVGKQIPLTVETLKQVANNPEENMEVVEGNRLLRRLRRLYHILSQQTSHLTSTSMDPVASFTSLDSYYQGGRENEESNRITAAHMYTWNCLSSLDNSNNNIKSRSGVNPDRYHLHARKSFPNPKPIATNATDKNYEAEDECEDTSDDDSDYRKSSSLAKRRYRNRRRSGVLHPTTTSSQSDLDSTDHEAYQTSRFAHSRKTQCNTLMSGGCISPTSSTSSVSSNDVNCMISSNDWPSWVVPCKECVVCWQKFRSGVRLSALPCGHGFHEHCIRKWLDTGAFDCPVCRWPAYAPHLRQQCQMIEQLISAVQKTVNFAKHSKK